jgi:hypothetical protein
MSSILLSEGCYSEGSLTGTQRKIKADRTSLIAYYIHAENCTFPNSVILGANFTESGDYIDSDTSRWSVETSALEDGVKNYTLIVPSAVIKLYPLLMVSID